MEENGKTAGDTTTTPAPTLEPSNHLHRPTSAKTQDVGHILSKQFGEQFIREAIDPQVVQNLRVSQRGSSDPYHEEFLGKLLSVVDSRQRRLDKLAQLERSIMAAKARAMLADERLANRLHSGRAGYPELGLPAPSSHFRACLDAELLRSNGLIGPTDLVSRVPPPVPPPSGVARSDLSEPQRKRTAASAGSAASSGAAGKRSSRLWSAASQPQQRTRGDSKSELLEADADEADVKDDEVSRVSEGSYRVPSAPRQQSPRQKKIEKLAKKKNLNWQEECSTEGRGEARKLLANMESRVGFLPNPKFLLPMDQGGNGNLLSSKLTRDPADTRIFVSNPEKIVFSDYQIGQVYQQSVELRNISCAMRYIRVIPPRSQYFSLSLGQFPGEFGQVAPGLCARFDVSFAPDSLRDFEDEIAVETQATGATFTVRIEARRPRPILTIPSELDVGQCLVYGSKTVYLRLSNKGGDGSFAIVRADQWPATNLKRAVQGDSATDGIFELRPSCFNLPRGATSTLEVTFTAREVKIFKSEFVIVCDNCQAKELMLIGEGQRPAVAIVAVDSPGVAEPQPGESTDAGAEALLRFEAAHPYTYCQRSVTLKNLANVELPFEWKIVKPFCRPPVPDEDEVAEARDLPGHRTLDADSPFTIEPEFGLLGASASQEFSLTFAPSFVSDFHSALHLLLMEVPLGPAEQQRQASPNGALQALELECKAACEPFSVRLEPAAVQIPGDILVGTTIRQRLRLCNSSRAPVSFAWDSVADLASIVELEPRTGSIEAGSFISIDLCLTGTRPGQLDYSLSCRVQHLDEQLVLRVLASVRGVQIQLQQPDVNFGLLEVGKLAEQQLRLLNPCQLECHWSVHAGPDCELRFEPPSSRLGPLEEQQVTVRYRPSQAQTLNEVFRIDVANGESTFVSAFAEVQSPAVCVLEVEKLLEIADLYLDVKSAYTVQLYNQTRLRCQFEWQEAALAPSDEAGRLCETSVEPKSGWLEPRQCLPVTVYVTPRAIARLESLLIPCRIDGQDSPVVIELSGNMKGISVTYHCSEEPLPTQDKFPHEEADAIKRIDFGTVPIHAVSKRYLHIRNNTSIRAGFSMDVEFFKAVPPETEVILPVERSQAAAQRTKSDRNSLLSKTPNLADPKSKPYKHAFYDMCKLYLRQNKGAAVHCSPYSGTLEAYSVTTIELTAFNDMWGCYTDNLLVSVEALPIQSVPMALKVEGCPVIFTMTAGRPDQSPILRFGSHTHGSKSVTRPVRLNNRSPFALRLDWRVFNVQPDDDQLLDLLCDFGKPFPPLDANGEEILPAIPGDDGEADGDSSTRRLGTGVLPDTPDTSAAPSRLDSAAEAAAAAAARDAEAELPPLRPVVLNVRPHEGRPAVAPFTVRPQQLTLHPESYDYVHVTFDSNSIESVTEAMDFNTYMLAFMSLDEERAQVSGKVHRGVGHEADQLRLDVTGSIVCPELDIDYNNDDKFAFNSAASDLLLMPVPASASPEAVGPAKTAFATLRNLRDTPLSFRLSLDSPFGIVQPKSAATMSQRPPPDADKEEHQEEALNSVGWSSACGPVSLTPRQTCLLELGFAFDWTMLQLVRESEARLASKGVQLTVNEATGERCLKFQGQLKMQFANGSSQSLPLSACLRLPSLSLSQTELDFGICMVGQRRELNFTVANSTSSGSKWRAKLVRESDTCEPSSTFTFSPSSGYLDGSITYLSRNKMLIKVFFTPKHSESYSAELEFRGALEEEIRTVRLSGSGSYDEQYKTIYNE
ncbi:hypothetical protein BOX15_Mlig031628g2 [Macrostomum lignano]|uniref:Deleted in lung and esophageal cancer protein 1 n=1 Tax=Macrostomum lignano TaxID=282301 RepID=A0A267GA63_9PLAT|nr:hypothetical protein BOX15_Mlig031628g2 [Macrostomum lignano]